MKGKFLTWEQLQEIDQKQTAVLVTYTSPRLEELKNPLIRVLVKGFSSRIEAWEWCKTENIKRKVFYEKGEAVQMEVKLLRLDKIVREFMEKEPENAYAILVV